MEAVLDAKRDVRPCVTVADGDHTPSAAVQRKLMQKYSGVRPARFKPPPRLVVRKAGDAAAGRLQPYKPTAADRELSEESYRLASLVLDSLRNGALSGNDREESSFERLLLPRAIQSEPIAARTDIYGCVTLEAPDTASETSFAETLKTQASPTGMQRSGPDKAL